MKSSGFSARQNPQDSIASETQGVGEKKMDVIVCVKHVPKTADVELIIDSSGKRIRTEKLEFDINEWDEYALEEALLIKERFGVVVTAITVGPQNADKTLRKCLAKGADRAIRLWDRAFEGSDGYAIAKILKKAIEQLPFDLILTGTQAADDGYSQVGAILAELLHVPHVTIVKKLEPMRERVRVNRELEGGLEQIVEVRLPALFSIQTGINNLRYVSIMGIKKARRKEITVLGLRSLNLRRKDVGEAGSWVTIEALTIPQEGERAEVVTGEVDDIATKIIDILKARGVV